MNAMRWKLLQAYLPSVAAVVNSFESTEVQLRVFETLVAALDEKTLAEAGVAVSVPLMMHEVPEEPQPMPQAIDLGVELMDGASIHNYAGRAH